MHLLASLSWDPQLRGFLIPALGVLILCGLLVLFLAYVAYQALAPG